MRWTLFHRAERRASKSGEKTMKTCWQRSLEGSSLGVSIISDPAMDAQHFCFPMLAEILGVNIRCYHLGGKVSDVASEAWCKVPFVPKTAGVEKAKIASMSTLYFGLSMSSCSWEFNTAQEFEESCKVTVEAGKHGAGSEEFNTRLPVFKHFVPLLPPKEEVTGRNRKSKMALTADDKGSSSSPAAGAAATEAEVAERKRSAMQLQQRRGTELTRLEKAREKVEADAHGLALARSVARRHDRLQQVKEVARQRECGQSVAGKEGARQGACGEPLGPTTTEGDTGVQQVIFTDADLAMTAAVENVLPNTRHLYCIWHIFNNIPKNCAGAFSDRARLEELMRSFKNAAFSVSEEAFLKHRDGIVRVAAGTRAEQYVDSLLSDKERWAFYSRSTALVLGMSSTQRVESFFSSLKRILQPNGSLVGLGEAIRKMCDSQGVETKRLGAPSVVDRPSFVDRNTDELFQPILGELKTLRVSTFVTERIRREFGFAMAYDVAELESTSSNAADILQDLRGDTPPLQFCQPEPGTEFAGFDVGPENNSEDCSMYPRTSRQAFVDMLQDSDMLGDSEQAVEHVFRVTYRLLPSSPSHTVVLGPEGFHLCSCLQLLQHGFPCRHVFAVMILMTNTGHWDNNQWFDATCVHPRWRATRSLENERWTGYRVLPDDMRWNVAEGPSSAEEDAFGEAGEIPHGGGVGRLSAGERRRIYADGIAMSREIISEISASVSSGLVAQDIYASLREQSTRLLQEDAQPTVAARGGDDASLKNPREANIKRA